MVADGAGMVDVRSMAIDGGVCIPVGVMPPDARPLRGSGFTPQVTDRVWALHQPP